MLLSQRFLRLLFSISSCPLFKFQPFPDYFTCERIATEYALTIKNRLNRTIYLPKLNAFTLGELLFFFELETAYAGEMLNIDTYNQPGVEEGKNATYALLGKNGYEKKREELNNAKQKLDKYII